MATITAVFDSAAAAESAIASVKALGVDESRISYLMPGEPPPQVNSSTGTGKFAGTALGGVLGMGASTFLIPGLGPIAGFGLMAGALAGAALGAAAGKAVDHNMDVPKEEVYFYEEALRSGRVVVVVDADDADQETQVRNILEHSAGRSVESLRREWWSSVRHSEAEYARARGHDFDADELNYRWGFEAALHPETRGRDYEQVTAYVERCYPGPCKTEAFRVGFDRGKQYLNSRSSGEVH